MLTRDGIGSGDSQHGLAIPGMFVSSGDYSSCWSALPDLLRARVECQLGAAADGVEWRSGSPVPASDQTSCRA